MTSGTSYSPPPAFGKLTLLHQIGAGVLGPVFRTHDPEGDRLVAVKAFTLDITPEQAAELAAEFQRLVDLGLDTPFLAVPVGTGVEDFVAFLASQYVAGESLDAAVRQYGPAPAGDAARLVAHVAEALDTAARVGVFHGALHPRDVLVTPGETHVTGIGVAKALERIGLHGPLRRPYVAPERENGEEWGAAADIFSLAAISYEVLTGRRAMPGSDQPLAGLADLPARDVGALRDVIESGLDPDPERRPARGAEFAAAFAQALLEGRVSPGAGERSGGQRPRRPREKAPKLPGLDEPLTDTIAPGGAAAPSPAVAERPRTRPKAERQRHTPVPASAPVPAPPATPGPALPEADAAALGAEVSTAVDTPVRELRYEPVDESSSATSAESSPEPVIEMASERQPAPLPEPRPEPTGEAGAPAEPAPEPVTLPDAVSEAPPESWPQLEAVSDPESLAEPAHAAKPEPEPVTEPASVPSDTLTNEPEALLDPESLDEVFDEPPPAMAKRMGQERFDELPPRASEPVDTLSISFTPEARDLAAAGYTPVLEGLTEALAKIEPPTRQGTGESPADEWRDPGAIASEPAVPRALDPLAPPTGTRLSRTLEPEPYRPAASVRRDRANVAVMLGFLAVVAVVVGVLWWAGTSRPESILPPGTVVEVTAPAVRPPTVAAPAPGPTAAPSAKPPAPTTRPAAAPAEKPTAPAGPTVAAPSIPPASTPSPAATVPSRAAPRAARAATGGIRVRSTPSGADVFVEGERRGVTPRNLMGLPYGTYTIRVTRPGYVGQERQVTIGPTRRDVRVNVRLARVKAPPKPAPAPRTPPRPAAAADPTAIIVATSISVETRPPGASVRVDGKDVGVSPLTLSPVAPGTHRVEFRLPGYRPWSTTVTVAVGKRARVTASLERDTPR